MEKDKIYAKAIALFGKEKQMIMAIEEMSELIKEVSKALRFDEIKDKGAMVEEIADVEIMLEQLKIITRSEHEVETVKDQKKDQKLLRLKKLLE